MTRLDTHGLTLLELMMALALGGVVLLGARLLVAGAAETGTRAVAAQEVADSTTLPLRTLRDLLRRVEVGTDSLTTFVGGPGGMAFTTWCDTANGWPERCRAVLDAGPLDGGLAVRVRTGRNALVALRPVVTTVQWRYLEDPGNGGRWASQWGSRLTAPLAVLLVMDGDSLLLRIGERG